jgi:hypothetical protein
MMGLFSLQALEASVTFRHGLLVVAANVKDPIVRVDLESNSAHASANPAKGGHFANAVLAHLHLSLLPGHGPAQKRWMQNRMILIVHRYFV